MTGVTIEVRDERVLEDLQRLMTATDDPSPALKNVGIYLVRSTQERIVAQRAPDGRPWVPLNPIYAKGKKGPGMLRESGELYSTIVYQLAGNHELEEGTDRAHARVHQFGAEIVPKTAAALVFEMGGETFKLAKVTIPARPFLGLSDVDIEEIHAIFEDFLELAAGGAIGGP